MPQKTAIITFTIGPHDHYERLFLPSVREYAKRIGADYHQIKELPVPMDVDSKSPVIRKHLICMQKMLIAGLDWVQQYDWILLIDADILVNFHKAPNIFEQVKDGFINGVNEREQFGLEDYAEEAWKLIDSGKNPSTVEEYYTKYGFEVVSKAQMNGGFLVFQPRIQKEFFRATYDKYMPKILQGQDVDGDQGPLNVEGWTQSKLHLIDPRWNRCWMFAHAILYPFLNEENHRKLLQEALKRTFDLNYCIHMSGYYGWNLLLADQ